MDRTAKEEADRRLESAVEEDGAWDPRVQYRELLRELRRASPEAYEEAVAYFRDELVPSIAQGEAEPLRAWREYGRLLAGLTAQGRTVALDRTGRAAPFTSDTSMDHLIVHLPESKGTRALLVSLPPKPSWAQQAAHDLLVAGKHRLTGSTGDPGDR